VKDVAASYNALVELFERIQFFLSRLNIYTNISLTATMAELLGKVMGHILSVLALSTKEMKQPLFSEFIRLSVTFLTSLV
jgi:hypothetical protein